VFLTLVSVLFMYIEVTVDGAMLAGRDFGFMLTQGVLTTLLQIFLLKAWCSSLSNIYTTFTLRLGSYALVSLVRVFLGFGPLGRVIRGGTVNGDRIHGNSAKAVNGQS
jgi:hypothetical protein